MKLMMTGKPEPHKERERMHDAVVYPINPHGVHSFMPMEDYPWHVEESRRRRAMYDDPWHEEELRRRRAMYEDMRRGRPRMCDDAMDMHEEMRRGRPRSMMDMPEHRQIGFMPSAHMDHGELPLDPRLDAVLEDAAHVLKQVPQTWEPYVKAHDYMGILRMEGRELLKALDQGKSIKDVRKELTHTLAALFQMLVK